VPGRHPANCCRPPQIVDSARVSGSPTRCGTAIPCDYAGIVVDHKDRSSPAHRLKVSRSRTKQFVVGHIDFRSEFWYRKRPGGPINPTGRRLGAACICARCSAEGPAACAGTRNLADRELAQRRSKTRPVLRTFPTRGEGATAAKLHERSATVGGAADIGRSALRGAGLTGSMAAAIGAPAIKPRSRLRLPGPTQKKKAP